MRPSTKQLTPLTTLPEPSPLLFVIAGPNGAGKTTFYETVLKPRIQAPFINADLIQRDELAEPSMKASYEAARLAETRRQDLIAAQKSFVTETVFSHPSKLDLLTTARASGYRLVVFHLNVRHPDLSVARVEERVKEGGHPVPEDKIRGRYERNQSLIRTAIMMADRGGVYDSSALNAPPVELLRFTAGVIMRAEPDLPDWCEALYAASLKRFRAGL
ncbi:MAG: zeta toxin family protein [Henriciella sp.]|nr:zeta toxin family protein [Henriciella sp.]